MSFISWVRSGQRVAVSCFVFGKNDDFMGSVMFFADGIGKEAGFHVAVAFVKSAEFELRVSAAGNLFEPGNRVKAAYRAAVDDDAAVVGSGIVSEQIIEGIERAGKTGAEDEEGVAGSLRGDSLANCVSDLKGLAKLLLVDAAGGALSHNEDKKRLHRLAEIFRESLAKNQQAGKGLFHGLPVGGVQAREEIIGDGVGLVVPGEISAGEQIMRALRALHDGFELTIRGKAEMRVRRVGNGGNDEAKAGAKFVGDVPVTVQVCLRLVIG